MSSKIYGYLKVQSDKQNLENDKAAILLKSNELKLDNSVEWIEEIINGNKFWKTDRLEKLIMDLQSGDVIIANNLSDFGKKYFDILNLLVECAKKQIKIYYTNSNIKIDSDTDYQIILLSHKLNTQLKQEQHSWKNKDKIILGRKEGSILDKQPENVDKVKEMLEKDVKIKVIAKELNCTTVTIRKFIREHKLKEFKKKEHKLKNDPDIILSLEQQQEIKKELEGPEKPKYKNLAKKYDLSVHKLNYLIRAYKLKPELINN